MKLLHEILLPDVSFITHSIHSDYLVCIMHCGVGDFLNMQVHVHAQLYCKLASCVMVSGSNLLS